MSSEWEKCTLGDFVRLQRGHDLTATEQQPGSVPIMGSAGQNGTHNRAIAKGPGVVIGRSGASAGKVHFTSHDYWPHNTCLYVTDFLGNDPLFTYYLLTTVDLASHNSGSAQPSLNRNYLYSIPLQVPLPPEQRQIAEVLRSLDDRITLLRETNATLEAIAQALFKSWFVDFDPVRAKAEGRSPDGMDEATAALFPDGFEESELGLVPRGWAIGVLGDIAQTSRRQVKASELHEGQYYVGLEHISRKSLTLSSWDLAEGLESAKAVFDEGDILFGKLRPYFHKVVIAPFEGVCSTDILVCRPVSADYYGVAAMHLFSESIIHYADRFSNGAKMPRVNWKDLAAYPLAIPPASIARAYSETIEPMLSKMRGNTQQAQTLATLRDTLLPRLISGQLRLPEAEREIQEVA
ncbi:MAG TPA: restriction endonuclease subunit S [Rhodocyclaceae bacterium]|nr:restriction endonuclease subunit S [Rhodocyclaceae bacterium]HRQ47962.1 restriction endonuclease subunit S [Rhodocyclaceae bacterium]